MENQTSQCEYKFGKKEHEIPVPDQPPTIPNAPERPARENPDKDMPHKPEIEPPPSPSPSITPPKEYIIQM